MSRAHVRIELCLRCPASLLTTLAGPFEEAGRVAVDLLLSMRDPVRNHPPRRDVVLPSHLAIRGSTGQARTQ